MIKQAFAPMLGMFLAATVSAQNDLPFNVEEITSFDEPWSMAFMPDGRMLVTEKKGSLIIVTQDGDNHSTVGGLPDVDYGGQGGLGDVALHPDFAENGMIYISYVESGDGAVRGAAGLWAARRSRGAVAAGCQTGRVADCRQGPG